MALLGLLELLVIAAVCGAIGHLLVGESASGCLISSVTGLAGAVLGSWLAGFLDLPKLYAITIGGQPIPIVWSVAGWAALVVLAALVTRRRMLIEYVRQHSA
jgi:MYXO-CTERM domain-containing protein